MILASRTGVIVLVVLGERGESEGSAEHESQEGKGAKIRLKYAKIALLPVSPL